MLVGKKIYYDKEIGNVILDTDEMCGDVIETTIDHDFNVYKELKERVKESVGVIKLEYGQYTQDFMECNGYRVNPTTLELEFSYPNPNLPPEEQPIVFQKPLTEQMSELTNTVDLILTEIIPSIMGGI